MENHLYEFMYDVLQRRGHSDQTLPALNRLKVRLHSRRLQKILDDNNDADRPDRDQLTIYQIFQTKRRRAAHHILLERWNRADAYDTERNSTDSYNVSTEQVRHNRGERCQPGKIDGGSPLRAA